MARQPGLKFVNFEHDQPGKQFFLYRLINLYIPVLFWFLYGYTRHPAFLLLGMFFLLYEVNLDKGNLKFRY